MAAPDHAPHASDHAHGLWTHGHVFLGHGHAHAERRAKLAAALTAVFMAVEIAAGLIFGSMALLADGIHMATHVGALGLAAAAYWLARATRTMPASPSVRASSAISPPSPAPSCWGSPGWRWPRNPSGG